MPLLPTIEKKTRNSALCALHPVGLVLLVVLAAWIVPCVSAQPTVRLTGSRIDLSPGVAPVGAVGYAEFRNPRMTPAQMEERPGIFVPIEELSFHYERPEQTVWLRILVANPAEHDAAYYLHIRKGHFWKAYFHAIDSSGTVHTEGSYSELRVEYQPDVLSSVVSFAFDVPATEERRLYLRLKAYDVARVGIEIVPREDHLRRLTVEKTTVGVLFGALLALLVYSVAIFRSLRSRPFSYYLGFLVSAVGYVLTVNRIGAGSLSGLPFIYNGVGDSLFAASGLFFMTLFARSYLDTKRTMRVIHHLLTAGLIAVPLVVAVDLSGVGQLRDLAAFAGLTLLCVLFAAGVQGMFQRRAVARHYLLSTTVFVIGAACSLATNLGFRPRRFAYLFEIGVQPGLVLCVLLFAVAISRRISELREERERLAVSNARTEEGNKQLREISRAKAELLARASHELRTPLANLRLPVEGIIAGRYGDTIGRAHSVFAGLLAQIDQLTHHVENLLVHSRVDLVGAAARLATRDLRQVATDFVRSFLPRAETSGIDLSLGPVESAPCLVSIDEGLFSSVIGNLIDNAIRYTPCGGSVTVSVARTVQNRVEMSVADTGPGIDEPTRRGLFTPFRSGSTSTGLGLGLALAKEITELHGGSLSLNTTPGSGACFVVSLPSARKAPQSIVTDETSTLAADRHLTQTHHDEPRQAAGVPSFMRKSDAGRRSPVEPTVLVVEDDAALSSNLAELLGSAFAVKTACSVEEALRILSSERVDLILSDVMMTDRDGFDLCRVVKAEPSTQDLPFVFLTARVEQEDAIRGFRAGAVDYIRKPFNGTELLEKLEVLLRERSASAERQRDSLIDHIRRWDGTGHVASPTTGGIDVMLARTTHGLTEKQTQVLDLVVKGYTDREVAGILGISPKTVGYHVSRLLERFGVERRTQLTHELIQSQNHNG